MAKDQELTVEIAGDMLVISIGISTLCFAATRGPYFDQLWGHAEQEPNISDEVAFAKAILTELKDEEEDGTTLVHRMFDSAAERAVENGAEGIRIPTDPIESLGASHVVRDPDGATDDPGR